MGPFGELSENSDGYVPNFGRTAPVDDDIMVHAEIEMRKNIFLINLGELAIFREDIVPNIVYFSIRPQERHIGFIRQHLHHD